MGAKIATTEPYREDDTPDEGYTGCGYTLIATDICTRQSSRKTEFSENWIGVSCSTFVADMLMEVNSEIHSEGDALASLKFLSSISENCEGNKENS